jgi:hypothetical protein
VIDDPAECARLEALHPDALIIHRVVVAPSPRPLDYNQRKSNRQIAAYAMREGWTDRETC